MHFVNESAPDARFRRRLAAAAKATAFARQRTISDGLASFTVEDICEEAGFSRRTFFNYFASKEDAVLGVLHTRGDEDLEDAFVDGDGDVFDDLITLAVARWTRHGVSRDDAAAIGAAITAEPKLLGRMLAHIHDTEQATTALIERREGYEAGDARAATAALVFGTLMRLAMDETFAHPEGPAYADVLRARVALARTLLSSGNHE